MRVIQVKIKWNLSIDQAEYTALNELIDLCGPEIPAIPAPPSEISSSFPASTPSPLPVQLDEGYGNQFTEQQMALILISMTLIRMGT